MPIQIKDFSWQQDNEKIYLNIPSMGFAQKNIDILTTPKFIKVAFGPYIFEMFLFSEINDAESSTEIGEHYILFKLKKQQINVNWNSLEDPILVNDRNLKNCLKNDAYKFCEERINENLESKTKIKQELNNFGVQKQIKLEEENRKLIENKKFHQKEIACEQLEQWKQQQAKFVNQTLKKEQSKENFQQSRVKDDDIFNNLSKSSPVREPSTINLIFTPRVFPTPIRETQIIEEDAWLKKQAEACQILSIEDSNLSEEERNPTWLKDKGDKFFFNEDYNSAVSAYSQAIRFGSKLPALYSNRAACHLKLNNLFKCIEDTSKALELLTPPVPQNLDSRIRSFIRRGTAFCLLNLFAEGLREYYAALNLDPDNEEIKSDIEKIKAKLQS